MSVSIPNASQSIVDGGLAIVPASNDGVSVKVGTSSTGAAGFYSYAGSDTDDVADDLGEGPLPDATVKNLVQSGGKQTVALKVAATTTGSSSAVTQSGAGPAVTISSGTPYDYALMVVKITLGGARGTATFQYSTNGGTDWSDDILTAATYALPTGVTIAFAAGTYVLNETYSWTDTADAFTASDVGDALDDIIDSAYDPEFVHILGYPTTAAGSATIAATVATKIASAHAAKRYFFVVIEEPPVDIATVVTAFASVSEKFLVVTAGFADIVENRSGQTEKMPIGRTVAPRIARNPVEVHLLRDVGDSTIDPLTDVVRLVPDGAAASTGYHDEDKTPAGNAARCTTLRTITGVSGFYVTNGLTMASGTSDFQQLQYARIILKVARASYAYQVTQLAKRVRINATTGKIDTKTRIAIQGAWESFIKASLGDAIGVCRVLIAETDLNADPTIYAQVRVTVSGYALVWSSTIGLASSLPAAA
jgi:hypothetical protein